MYKKAPGRGVAFAVALILFLTSFIKQNIKVYAAGELPSPNTAARHTVCTALSEAALNYYSGEYSYENLVSLPGAQDISDSYAAAQNNELFDALRTLMSETHTYYTKYGGYSKGALAYYWPYTDAVSSGSSYIMFYSDIAGDAPGAVLNREHIWPKSRASFNETSGGADLHHLRPSLDYVNRAKSNHAFGYVNGTYKSGYTTGEVNGEACYYLYNSKDLFECKDDVKGDVARILLYVYCRWGQPNLFSDVPQEKLPPFDKDDSANSGERVIESLDTLLLWCESDPVDAWEMGRNDSAESVQGNRNVFIDFPELAWLLFGRAVPAGMASPTNEGCRHEFTESARRDATAGSDGFFTLHCTLCGNERTRKLTMGEYLPGDINGDRSVDNKDLARLLKRLSGWSVEVSNAALDTNGDNAVNNKDLTRLFKKLSGLSVEIF